MTVYTLNLRVFWPLFTCVLTGLVVLHHITHRLTSEQSHDPACPPEAESCSNSGPPILLSLAKLFGAVALCFLFIRYCSAHPTTKGAPRISALPKSSESRRQLLEDYYDRWVRLSPHVVGHSKANVSKLIGDLVRAGRTNVPPESSLAFRGDFLQVGSSYEEHKVTSPDCFDILVPLRVPRELKLDPRVIWREEVAGENEEQRDARNPAERGDSGGEGKLTLTRIVRRRASKGHKSGKGKAEEKKEDHNMHKKDAESQEAVKKEEPEKEVEKWGQVPRCSLEVPHRDEWVRRHRAFTDTFLRLHPQGYLEKSSIESAGGATGNKAYRLTPESVLRWFYPAVQRCLSAVRYPHEQRCVLSLSLSNEHVHLNLTPRSDYVCCHISMTIRLLPALPLGDGLYLVPTEPSALSDILVKTRGLQEKDLWMLFFPRQEQRLFGWLRTRVPQSSCHLKCLQLIKAIRDLGAQALDIQGAAMWRSVLSSYVLKTVWLQLLLSTPPEAWEECHLVARLEDLIQSLRDLLQKQTVTHLFLGGKASTRLLPDSVALPKLVKEAAAGAHGNFGGNLWAKAPPASLDLVSRRLAYAWTHLHRLIRLSRPQRGGAAVGRAGHGHCQHLEMD